MIFTAWPRAWPIDMPRDRIKWVNTPITARELDRLQLSLKRGRPFGRDRWVLRTAERLKLEHTLRREGRPSRQPESEGESGN